MGTAFSTRAAASMEEPCPLPLKEPGVSMEETDPPSKPEPAVSMGQPDPSPQPELVLPMEQPDTPPKPELAVSMEESDPPPNPEPAVSKGQPDPSPKPELAVSRGQLGPPPQTEVAPLRILFIHFYDSFSYNIVTALEREPGVIVDVCDFDRIQNLKGFFESYQRYDGVIIGPSGMDLSADGVKDFVSKILSYTVPVLGIGFGFHLICRHFGAKLQLIYPPHHGTVANVEHSGRDIFEGLPDLQAALFHSLEADIGHSGTHYETGVINDERWTPTHRCPDLIPLAWCTAPHLTEAMLMAVCHKSKPLWGLQFRPESCASDPVCSRIFSNWLTAVRDRTPCLKHDNSAPSVNRQAKSMGAEDTEIAHWLLKLCTSSSMVSHRVIPLCDLTSDMVGELIDVPNAESVVLVPDPRFTIMSVASPGAWRLEYSTSASHIYAAHLLNKSKTGRKLVAPLEFDIFAVLSFVNLKKRATGGHPDVPFWGGFMGLFSHEMGIHKWTRESRNGLSNTSDACFLWVERSIVIDHEKKYVHIQSLRESDNIRGEWLDLMMFRLMQFYQSSSLSFVLLNLAVTCPQDLSENIYIRRLQRTENQLANLTLEGAETILPSNKQFKRQLSLCREAISKGDSYEMYLTHEAIVKLPPCRSRSERNFRHWILYKRLRKLNSTAESAFAKIGSARVVSCDTVNVVCCDRTLMVFKKSGVQSEQSDKAAARKEENSQSQNRSLKTLALIITATDLAFSEVSQLCRSIDSHMELQAKMGFSDQATRFASEISGRGRKKRKSKKGKGPSRDRKKAWHSYVPINCCLPPASMTGVPQRISAEALDRRIEKRARSIYSGVIGYLDVGGGGSFSLLSRTAFTWSNGQEAETWTVGAGASVSAWSDNQEAIMEMKANFDAVLPIFKQLPEPSVEEGEGEEEPLLRGIGMDDHESETEKARAP